MYKHYATQNHKHDTNTYNDMLLHGIIYFVVKNGVEVLTKRKEETIFNEM